MVNNQNENKDIDADFEKAKQSMGGRVDPDEPATPPVETPAPKEESKEDITPAPTVPPKDEPTVPDVVPTPEPPKKVVRSEAYIPMPKYLSEKAENARLLADKDTQLADALKKVEELSNIAKQGEGAQKDEDIESFMDETGFSREVVEGFLKLASKRLLTPEKVSALETAERIVKEANLEASFAKEMETSGIPELKKRFPAITEAQIEDVQDFLDKVAHTPEFHDKPLDFIIYKHQSDIEKLFGDVPAGDNAPIPQDKKTIEGGRIGAGKIVSLSAKDFDGKTDFSELNDMDPATRSKLIADFPVKTYENFKSWVAQQEPGVEVMRDGKKVLLK